MNATPCNSGGTVTLNAEGAGPDEFILIAWAICSSGALVT